MKRIVNVTFGLLVFCLMFWSALQVVQGVPVRANEAVEEAAEEAAEESSEVTSETIGRFRETKRESLNPSQSGQWNNVSTDGEYKILVPGQSTVGPGPGNIPWRFSFSDTETGESLDSVIVATAEPVTKHMHWIPNNWDTVTKYLETYAQRTYGDLLTSMEFNMLDEHEGNPAYSVYLTLSDGEKDMEITTCYRFEKSYSLFIQGLNYGDLPDMREMTEMAAAAFEDNTAQPGSANPVISSDGVFTAKLNPWPFDVANLFSVMTEYTMWNYPGSAGSVAGDDSGEEIVFSDANMEAVIRSLAGKPEGAVYTSNLAVITEIYLSGQSGETNTYQLSTNDIAITFETEEPLTALPDLQCFTNVTDLRLEVDTINDVTVLRNMPQLTSLDMRIYPKIADLTPMGSLVNLENLMMWGPDYTEITDISFFGTMKNLEVVFFIGSNIKDASVFVDMPNLSELYLNAHDDLNQQPLIDAKHIVALMLNTESIREKESYR